MHCQTISKESKAMLFAECDDNSEAGLFFQDNRCYKKGRR